MGMSETAILEAEQRRCDAMLANDAAALDALLDARLCFNHANGASEGKPAYLAKIAAGRIQYAAITWDEQTVIALNEQAALINGRMTMLVTVEGVEKKLVNRVLQAWAYSGGAWRLAAFQSTPLNV